MVTKLKGLGASNFKLSLPNLHSLQVRPPPHPPTTPSLPILSIHTQMHIKCWRWCIHNICCKQLSLAVVNCLKVVGNEGVCFRGRGRLEWRYLFNQAWVSIVFIWKSSLTTCLMLPKCSQRICMKNGLLKPNKKNKKIFEMKPLFVDRSFIVCQLIHLWYYSLSLLLFLSLALSLSLPLPLCLLLALSPPPPLCLAVGLDNLIFSSGLWGDEVRLGSVADNSLHTWKAGGKDYRHMTSNFFKKSSSNTFKWRASWTVNHTGL